jgi:hypothetical protein
LAWIKNDALLEEHLKAQSAIWRVTTSRGPRALPRECSFSKDEFGPNYGWDPKEKIIKRVSDKDFDIVLLQILEKARKEVTEFKPRTQLARLKESIDYLAEHKIET